MTPLLAPLCSAVCSNTIELEKINLGQRIDYGTLRDNSEMTAPDYASRVQLYRPKIRAEQW